MNIKQIVFALLTFGLIGCNSTTKETYPDIKIVGALKNVMWKGELGSSIDLDTISDKNGLYGLGPVSYLTGELLINNGESYVSIADLSIQFDCKADFEAQLKEEAELNKRIAVNLAKMKSTNEQARYTMGAALFELCESLLQTG